MGKIYINVASTRPSFFLSDMHNFLRHFFPDDEEKTMEDHNIYNKAVGEVTFQEEGMGEKFNKTPI